MSGTCMTDLNALSPTTTAKTIVSAKGADISALINMAKRQTAELTVTLKQIVALHPSGGPDAANYAALNAVIAELI